MQKEKHKKKIHKETTSSSKIRVTFLSEKNLKKKNLMINRVHKIA